MKGNYSWKKIRKRILKRDKCKCQSPICKYKEQIFGETSPLIEVHHIIPRRFFKPKYLGDREDNLISYCWRCHKVFDRMIRAKERKIGKKTFAFMMKQKIKKLC